MKKFLNLFVLLALLFSLCACNAEVQNESDPATSSGNVGFTNGSDGQTQNEEETKRQGLKNLTSTNYAYCSTQEGYYYVPEESVELADGSWGTHIMYMDFATSQEVYLCSDAGCSHDNKSCSAVLSEDEYSPYSGRIFAWNGKLYLLDKDADRDGFTTIDLMLGQDMQAVQAETRPATLYQMNFDGSNRKKIYTFADGITLEDTILSSEDGIYFVTKKLETDIDGNTTVTTSTDRNIVRFSPANKQLKTIMSLQTDDGISWRIVGCYDNSLVLEGIEYENGNSGSADMSDAEWKDLYNKSQTVFATLDLSSQKHTEVYRVKNKGIHASATHNGFLYVSEESSNDIIAIDLRTGRASTLASLTQNNIMGVFSDQLICRTWDLTNDYTLHFLDTKDGQISHCTLTNKCNEWPLEVICEAGNDALVIYDYKADANSDGSYEIYQYKYALIAKEDLYAGKNTFRPIKMIGKGR